MIKILFVMESLGAGGAERVLVNLVNQMDRTKFTPAILTLFEDGVNAAGLADDVKLISPGLRRFRGMKTVLKRLPKKAIYQRYVAPFLTGKYDLIVAYMTGVPTFVVAGADVPKIAWIHGEFFPGRNVKGQKQIYDRYDAVAGVSDHVCETFNRVIRSENRAVTIYNTNDTERIKRLSLEPYTASNDGWQLVSVGCLEKTKGYDRLIAVCGRLKTDGVCFHLRILGEGPERKGLQEQIEKLGLADQITLTGYCQNPFPIVRHADLFVCSSRTEGLSTAVSEAIILGVPVVSTDVSGAKEILGNNNEYGLVTENSEDGLYDGVRTILSDEKLLTHYREKASERAAFFDASHTVKQTEQLFSEVIQSYNEV